MLACHSLLLQQNMSGKCTLHYFAIMFYSEYLSKNLSEKCAQVYSVSRQIKRFSFQPLLFYNHYIQIASFVLQPLQ